MKYEDLDQDSQEGIGCIMIIAFSVLFLAIAFVVGGLFGWYWGVAMYLGGMGLFVLNLLSKAFKE